MAYLSELGLFQAKILRTGKALIELERTIAATADSAEREHLARQADSLRAFLRVYEGMVSFLNSCIEIERHHSPAVSADPGNAKQA